MSRTTINGESYEIPDNLILITREQYFRLCDLAGILSDLDRSEHGRHEGDVEGQTEGGRSFGNPLFQTGAHIGWNMSGDRIIVPPVGSRTKPDAWVGEREGTQ